eukprot:TRINITY_DN10944_c0_g1_i1.p1 TRINITY_DN10944_c0_g1~~TRINITY_DN10944_c0_g1_i1.p1  ORF type:complete len:416 (-),score=78.96 TRINITY_DN10944_c0_g1_i1:203-1450(-)
METASELNIGQIATFPCPIHVKRKLEYVSEQKQAPRRLLCSDCLLHFNGDLKQVSNIEEFMEKCLLYPSLKEGKAEILSTYESRYSERMMHIFESLDQLSVDFNNEINKVKSKIQEELEQRRADLSNKIDELVRSRHVLNVPKTVPAFDTKDNFVDFVEKQLLMLEREKAILRPLHANYGMIKRDYLNREIYQQFESYHSKARDFVDNFNKRFPSESVSKMADHDLRFSQTEKYVSLTVKDNGKTIQDDSGISNCYQVAFMDLNLAEVFTPVSWYIKVSTTGQMGSGFGIASLKRVKAGGFCNFTGTVNQGFNILMDTGSLVTDTGGNQSFSGFGVVGSEWSLTPIKRDTVVMLTFDPNERTLTFKFGKEKKTIKDIPQKDDDPYYPCAFVYTANEAMTIVSEYDFHNYYIDLQD